MSIGRIEKQILEKMQTNAKVRKFYGGDRKGRNQKSNDIQ